ncbi:hypothetical protein BH10PSE1_BH10PSE1_25250 [soil metagenome]
MKSNPYSGLMALSAVALLAGAAAAQTATPMPVPMAARADAPARHARLDTDGDRKISQVEFVQARTARLTALDTNHDGSLTREEVQARRQAARTEHAQARFERLDADKDGQISRAEFDAPRPQQTEGARAGRGERGHHRGGQRMGRHEGRGHGPAQRMADRGPVSIADATTRATETFTRLDADHDGFLTAAEARAGRGDRAGRGEGRHGQRMGRHMSRPMAPAATPASPPAPASE